MLPFCADARRCFEVNHALRAATITDASAVHRKKDAEQNPTVHSIAYSALGQERTAKCSTWIGLGYAHAWINYAHGWGIMARIWGI
eukprot:5698933-Prymnesium_polylepis.2